MNATINSNVDETKDIPALRKELEEVTMEIETLKARQWEIANRIRALQAICPHKSKTEEWVLDVAEMKVRNFCIECGAQC